MHAKYAARKFILQALLLSFDLANLHSSFFLAWGALTDDFPDYPRRGSLTPASNPPLPPEVSGAGAAVQSCII